MDLQDPIPAVQESTIQHSLKFRQRISTVKSNDIRVSSETQIRIVKYGITVT